MAGFGRIALVGATVAVALGTVALRAQTALEDPKNSPKIFANTCSACHKSPRGLSKGLGTSSFLRQHYTTGPEMSNAMAAYLASAGAAPPEKKGATKETEKKGAPKKDQVATTGRPDGSPEPAQRPKQDPRQDKKGAKATDPRPSTHSARPTEPQIMAPERGAPPAAPAVPAASAGLNTPPPPAEPAAPTVNLDLPLPPFPSEPPAELSQPPVFSSAPLP